MNKKNFSKPAKRKTNMIVISLLLVVLVAFITLVAINFNKGITLEITSIVASDPNRILVNIKTTNTSLSPVSVGFSTLHQYPPYVRVNGEVAKQSFSDNSMGLNGGSVGQAFSSLTFSPGEISQNTKTIDGTAHPFKEGRNEIVAIWEVYKDERGTEQVFRSKPVILIKNGSSFTVK